MARNETREISKKQKTEGSGLSHKYLGIDYSGILPRPTVLKY